MNEIRTPNVHAVPNPDGTWHVVFTRRDGTELVCPSAPEDLMRQAVEAGDRQQAEPTEAHSALAWVLSMLFSPTVLTAIAVSVFLGRGC